jgi:glycogen operon protein
LYEWSGRKPYASINFITCHDGFCLKDLVSYNHKHNEANKEGNRDGTDNNDSWNCGVEGPTEDPNIISLRARQKRNFIATLMLSQGVPMLLAGDELGHTQFGNNNTYCQDNELSWLNWDLAEDQQKFLAFVKKLTRFWREQPVLHRRKFFSGRSIRGAGITDISWFTPAGKDMSDEDWNAGYVKCLGMRLAGDLINECDERGEPIIGDTLLVILNAHHEPIEFTLPPTNVDHQWERVLDTADDALGPTVITRDGKYLIRDRSLAIFRTRTPADTDSPPSALQVEAMRREVERAGAPSSVGQTV